MIGQRNCATCFRIRLFLGVAVGLIIMIYIQPGAATRLAALTPSSGAIAWGMMGVGAVVFGLRYRAWKASVRR